MSFFFARFHFLQQDATKFDRLTTLECTYIEVIEWRLN